MSVHQTHNQMIATRIHGQVTKLLSAGANDLDIFTGMADQMDDFRTVLGSALPGEMDLPCARYEGFYRYVKILEEVAQGIPECCINSAIFHKPGAGWEGR